MSNSIHNMNLIIEKVALNSTEKILKDCNINDTNFKNKNFVIELIKNKDYDLANKLAIIYQNQTQIKSYETLKNDILNIFKMRGISRTTKINLDFQNEIDYRRNKSEQLEKLKVLAHKLVLLKKNSSSNIEYITLLNELCAKIKHSLLDFNKNNSNKQYQAIVKEIIKIIS